MYLDLLGNYHQWWPLPANMRPSEEAAGNTTGYGTQLQLVRQCETSLRGWSTGLWFAGCHMLPHVATMIWKISHYLRLVIDSFFLCIPESCLEILQFALPFEEIIECSCRVFWRCSQRLWFGVLCQFINVAQQNSSCAQELFGDSCYPFLWLSRAAKQQWVDGTSSAWKIPENPAPTHRIS